MENARTVVVVTGVSGFIGMHCAQQLLWAGYSVRGTLRSLDKADAVRAALVADDDEAQRLSFVEANLLEDEGWPGAMAGARYVLHVASPVPFEEPRDEHEVIRPALEGTRRVLRAASEAGVSRVVLTSSVAAIISGYPDLGARAFTEEDWSDLDGPHVSAYEKSKTLAERAAWDFVRGLGSPAMELVAINPVYVVGPSLLGTDNASNEVVGKLLRREVPGVPRLCCPVVDVRDTAAAHLLAMTTPEAAGKRFIVSAEICWMQDVARMLKNAGYAVPTLVLPNFLVRLVAVFDKTVAMVVPVLGQRVEVSGTLARDVLGWQGRSAQATILDTARVMAARSS